jgi:hypothetical protein
MWAGLPDNIGVDPSEDAITGMDDRKVSPLADVEKKDAGRTAWERLPKRLMYLLECLQDVFVAEGVGGPDEPIHHHLND